jgi:probable F420-dependent oxidoreductase
MDIDIMLPIAGFSRDAAVDADADGYDTLWIGETSRDPFLMALMAAEAAPRARVGTAIAVAFARNPMTVASSAYDLAGYTDGRFVLGLGSQVKAHIERRYSMPWSHPGPRMREFVLAMRAIWNSWETDAKLDFRGDFYSHTLMTPFFAPDRHHAGPPPIYLAGVGEYMTKVAGEVADGYLWHPFTTQRYLREVTIPAVESGRKSAEEAGLRQPGTEIALSGQAFVVTGRDDQELDAAMTGARGRIAFYASTPAYRAVLDLHGFGGLQPELTALSKRGNWHEMGSLIPDELVEAMAVIGTPEEAGRALNERWADVASSISLYAPYEADPSVWPIVAAAARGRS